jgi:hypothetical protein
MTLPHALEKHHWLIILPLAFLVYVGSFNSFPILEKKHSILGEADSAAFIVLITDFSLTKQYGDPYRLKGRTLEDIAQKHKIHHILYVMAASFLYQALSMCYALFGLPAKQAVYAINAVLGCINILLLYELLKLIDAKKKGKGFFLILYAFSLSSWIFYSVPESWSFSATLVLLFLVLQYNLRVNPFALAAYIGVAMLNNIFLGTLCSFVIILFWVEYDSMKTFLTKSLGAIGVVILTWLSLMTLLSVFDSGFRPDHYFQYTAWFKKHIAPPVVIFDTYFWKTALTHLYITSILSNQSVPNVPQESLLYTIQQSRFGLFATCIYLSLLFVLGWHGAREVCSQLRRRGGLDALLSTAYFPMGLYAVAWLFLTMIMDPSGGFLYSTIVTPMMVAVLYRFTDWQRRTHKILWAAALCAVLVNNAQQIMIFRTSLAAMIQ